MESLSSTPSITGIVLAAGAGTRFGMPKALARTATGEPWVALASELLLAAGCDRVIVVLGARAEEARALVPTASVSIAVAENWAIGMSESLRVGLEAASRSPSATAALVSLVDLPGLPLEVAVRVVGAGAAEQSLRQATFGGRPGHPVLIGKSHWSPLVATLRGDNGAREYLRANGATEVECSDLFDGHDVDR